MLILRSFTHFLFAIAVLFGAQDVRAADSYTVDVVVPGSPMKGVHGLAFDSDGVLHAVSITGMSTYKIDVESGAVETVIGPPLGVGDDLAFGPDGTLAWTARNAMHLQSPDGDIRVLVDGIDGVNSTNYGADGRLFYTLIFRADALYEGYPNSNREPRLIAEGMGGLNGFEVTGDGKIIGPLFFGNAIVSVDVESGDIETITDGIQTPAAVNLLSNGDIIALGYRTGKVFRIDRSTGEKTEIAELEGVPIDNLAIDERDQVFISHSSHNGITQLDPDTGETTRILWGDLSAPGGLTTMVLHGEERILAADAWSHRTINPATGDVEVLPVGPGVFGSTAVAADNERIILSNVWPNGMVQIIERGSGNALGNVFGLGAPYGVLTADDGGVLITDYAADALIHVAGDEERTRTTVAQGLGGPVGVARLDANAVYVTGHTDGTISWVSLEDGSRTVITDGLSEPEGLAKLPTGKLAVAEVGKRRVVIIDPGSGETTIAAEDLPIGFDLGGSGHAPALLTGVTATSDGSIYVTGDVDNSLIRLIPN